MRRGYSHRPHQPRPYRRLFVISTEGARDERSYFHVIRDLRQSHIFVKYPQKTHNSAPQYVLQRMQTYLESEKLKRNDEAWIVVDKDHWTKSQLSELLAWTNIHDNYHLALSNPKFEYWLLLHFEDGKEVSTAPECDERLKKYLPQQRVQRLKAIRRITLPQVKDAICRARTRDHPPCLGWPHDPSQTTVYRLVEKMIQGD